MASDFEGPADLETGAVYVIPGDAGWTAATDVTIDVSDAGDRATFDVARIALQGAVAIYDDSARYVPPLFGFEMLSMHVVAGLTIVQGLVACISGAAIQQLDEHRRQARQDP